MIKEKRANRKLHGMSGRKNIIPGWMVNNFYNKRRA